jgi:hypothetical protein
VATVAVAPWQPTGWNSKSDLLCGSKTTVPGANGMATILVCLVHYRTAAGVTYYQSTIEVTYAQSHAGGSDTFSGVAMGVPDATKKATTQVNCPSVTWGDGGDLWCFSATVTIHSPGARLYAKGVLIDAAGHQHPVWSPIFTTS